MAVAGEKNHVDDKGDTHPRKLAHDQPDEERGGPAVELDAAEAHNQTLGRPADKDGDRITYFGPFGVRLFGLR